MFLLLALFLFSATFANAGNTYIHPLGTYKQESAVWSRVGGGGAWTDTDFENTLALFYMDDTQRSNVYYSVGSDYADTHIFGDGYLGHKYDEGAYFGNSPYLTNLACVANIPATFSNLSFSTWWRQEDANELAGIIGLTKLGSTYGELGMGIYADATLRTYCNGTMVAVPFGVNTNAIVHLAMTYDGLGWNVYSNGVNIYTNTISAILETNDQHFSIGRFYASTRINNQTVKDCRMYKRTLTPTEVATVYAEGYTHPTLDNISTDDLVIRYPFTNTYATLQSQSTNRCAMRPYPDWANSPTKEVHGYRFDGIDDAFIAEFTLNYMDERANNPLSFGANDFAISIWYNQDITNTAVDGLISSQQGIAANGQWSLRLANPSTPEFYIENSDDITGTNIVADAPTSTGAWHNVYIRRDVGTELAMWVDGVKQADTSADSIDVGTVGAGIDISIGGIGAANFFDGLITDVRIYNYAKAYSEELYDATNPEDNMEEKQYRW